MFERMLDAAQKPSAEELARYCGENEPRFCELNEFLRAECQTTQEIRFPYGKRYGWCVTHRKGKKLICDVFAEAGAFCVMLRLSDEQFSLCLPSVSAYTQGMIEKRYPCGNGGWIHYRVQNDDDLHDAVVLLRKKTE